MPHEFLKASYIAIIPFALRWSSRKKYAGRSLLAVRNWSVASTQRILRFSHSPISIRCGRSMSSRKNPGQIRMALT